MLKILDFRSPLILVLLVLTLAGCTTMGRRVISTPELYLSEAELIRSALMSLLNCAEIMALPLNCV